MTFSKIAAGVFTITLILLLRQAAAADTFTYTSQFMNVARSDHSATLLLNGQVLLAGGFSNSGTEASVERYDLSTDTFTLNPLSMNTARADHTSTLLPSGMVLVAGGSNGSGGNVYASAEIYDPATKAWKNTSTSMSSVRTLHTATLLANGKVLVAGGLDNSDTGLSSADLYDPSTDTWVPTAQPMNMGRLNHTATLLPNGKVLVTGGQSGNALATAELYDPASDTWTPTAKPMNSARIAHTASLLQNGKVLIAGGLDASNKSTASAELYDPASDSFAPTSQPLITARDSHSATFLPSGKVLIAAGEMNFSTVLAAAEIYDPSADTFSAASQPLNTARLLHTATLLPGGTVLFAAGQDSMSSYTNSAELYDSGVPQPTVISIIAGDNQTAGVNTAVSVPPSVRIMYSSGVPAGPGTAVNFVVSTGGGSVTGGSTFTDQNSVATVGSWILGPNSGPNTLRVISGNAPPVTFTAIGTNGAPVITSLTTMDNPALVGTPVTYVLSATDADTPVLSYSVDYGDGSAPLTGVFPQGTSVTVAHTYTSPGNYTVTASVSDGGTSVSKSVAQSVPPPASSGMGVKNISDSSFEVINPLNNLGIEVIDSNGGVIQLGIDTGSLIREVFTVNTDFGDIAGRSANVAGVRPVHQYIHHGIFVAKTTVSNSSTGAPVALGRKTLVISSRETGEKLPSVAAGGGRSVVGVAPSKDIVIRNLQGKFTFSGKASDTVSFSGIIQLPANLDLSQPHEFSVALGNVVADTTIDARGSGAVPGSPPILRNLKVMYPRSARHGLTKGGESARIDVTISTAGLIAAGFDTEGIVKSARDTVNGTTAPRNIQIGMLLDGVPYESLAPTGFAAPNNADFGTISGRSGK